MDGDGGVDGHGGGFDGLSDHGHGHGHAGGHTDFDHHHGGAHSHGHDHDHGSTRTKRRPQVLDSDAINESLLLSYDHCTVYPPGSDCRDGGYNIVDANKGGFARDVTGKDGKERAGARALTPEQIEIVRKMADDPKRRTFGLHVVNHGDLDVMRTFAELALAMNCKRIDSCTPNFFQLGSYSILQDISDWNRFAPPFFRMRVPAGYYEGCTGTTTVWKQIWQVHKKEHRALLKMLGYPPSRPQDVFNCPPERHYNRDDNTVIEVFGVTWFYREAGDHETRFQITVVSNPELDWSDEQWGYRKEPFERHQKAARTIAEQMLNKLKEATPHAAAVKLRGQIVARQEGQQAVVVKRPVSPVVTTTAPEEKGEPKIIIATPDPKAAAGTGDVTGGGVPKPPTTKVKIRMPGERLAGDATSAATSTVTSTPAAKGKTGGEPDNSGVDIFSVLGKDAADGSGKPDGK